jgi:hypothetical protein
MDIIQKAESLFYSAGYVATLACPAMRPLMVELERLHCTETWLLIQLSAVMFAPSSIVLFYRHGKMNGLTLKATNCDWWSLPYTHGVPLSALSGKRKSFSHGYESVTHAWHMAICCEVSLPASVMTVAAHWLCHTFWETAHGTAKFAVCTILTGRYQTCLVMTECAGFSKYSRDGNSNIVGKAYILLRRFDCLFVINSFTSLAYL